MSVCCEPCTSVEVPGPQGPAGSDGADGADGVNAFTTGNSFTMPAELGNVTVTVANSTWFVPGGIVWAKGGSAQGYFEVQSMPDATHVILKNLADTPNSAYLDNSAVGTIFPNGTKIGPSGVEGPAGPAGSSGGASSDAYYLLQQPNAFLPNGQALSLISDGIVKNASGLLAPAVDGTDFVSNANLVARYGVTIQGYAANLQAFGLLSGAANKLPYFAGASAFALTDFTAFARTMLDDATAEDVRRTLRIYAQGEGVLGAVGNIDFNTAGDTVIPIPNGAFGFIVESLIVFNASTSLTTATAGVFTGAGGGGVQLAAIQSLAALTASTKFLKLTLAAVCGTDWRTETSLYFRVGTPQGAAALGAVIFYGKSMSN